MFKRRLLHFVLILVAVLPLQVLAAVGVLPHCNDHHGMDTASHTHDVGVTHDHESGVNQSDHDHRSKSSGMDSLSCSTVSCAIILHTFTNELSASGSVAPNVADTTNLTSIFLDTLQRPPRNTRA